MGKFISDYSKQLTEAQTLPAGEADQFDAFYDDQYFLNRSDSEYQINQKILQPIVDEIYKVTGKKFANPAYHLDAPTASMGGEADIYSSIAGYDVPDPYDGLSQTERFDKDIDAIVSFVGENLDLFDPESEVRDFTPMKLQQMLVAEANKIRENTLYAEERTHGWGDWFASMGGSFGAAATDPTNVGAVLASIPFQATYGSGMLSRLLIDVAAGVGAEAYIQDDVKDLYKQLGIDYGDTQYRDNLVAAGGGSFALGLLMETLIKLPGASNVLKKNIINKLSEYKSKQVSDEVGNPKIIASKDNADADSGVLLDDVNNATLEHNVNANDPNDASFIAKLNKAKEAVANDDFSKLPKDEQVKILDELYHDQHHMQIAIVEPDDIEIDAKTFQFKGGADELGMLETLEGVQEWNQAFAGIAVLYKNEKGKYVVADGHQRVNLAKRLKGDKNYKGPEPKITAIVYDAKDGFQVNTVRTLAAAKNIAEGSGTAIDAAKVFKMNPDTLNRMLPPKSKLRQYGLGLSKLSDDALDIVNKGLVPERYAQFVGNYVSGRDEQIAVLNLLMKTKPDNLIEAESIVAQAALAGFKEVNQAGLFADDMIAETLFKERSKILSGTLSSMNANKKVLTTLVNDSDLIEKFGNKLDKLNNAQRKDLYGQIIETIKYNANHAGDIADDLTAISRKLARGEIDLAQGIKEFQRAVQERISSSAYTRLSASQLGFADDVATTNNSTSKYADQNGPEQLAKYDNTTDGSLDAEIEALAADVKDQFDELESSGYDNIKQEKMFVETSADGVVISQKSFDDMVKDLDGDEKAIKELKDC